MGKIPDETIFLLIPAETGKEEGHGCLLSWGLRTILVMTKKGA